jgi:uncharacterized repeat protein (TIGR01451 family)
MLALQHGATSGRNGLGNVFVFSAGNGRTTEGDAGITHSSTRFAMQVAALEGDDTFAPYSSPGASVFVSAPGGASPGDITTTDRQGAAGYAAGDCTGTFNGTSAAAPLFSGVVALMLEANPTLTLRDVQHIIAATTVLNDPGNPSWQANGAGVPVSRDYGFGRVDAAAAVLAAQGWTGVGQQHMATTGTLAVNVGIPDNDPAGMARTVAFEPNLKVEHIEVVLNATHTWRGDLAIELTSPAGTVVKLAPQRLGDSLDNYVNWVFTTPHYWNELSSGAWTLRVSDEFAQDTGTWIDWRLNVYGTALPGDLGISKTGSPDPVARGGLLTYTIQVANHGASDVTGVRVMDFIPAGTRFVSATVTSGAGWVVTAKPSPGGTGLVLFQNPSFAGGATAKLTIVVRLNRNVPLGSSIVNTATIQSTISPGSTSPPSPDLDLSNNTAVATTLVN